MAKVLVLEQRPVTPRQLWAEFKALIETIADATRPYWGIAEGYLEEAVSDLRLFAKHSPKSGTTRVKYWFATLTTLRLELTLSDSEGFAVYAIAGLAHAAAHLGHHSVAAGFRSKADRKYQALQMGYVQFGMVEATEYAKDAAKAAAEEGMDRTTTAGGIAPSHERVEV